jgi:hypothetical protein
VLYPAGRYPTALVIGMAADRAISISDVTFMTVENLSGVEYIIRRVSGILSPAVSLRYKKFFLELGPRRLIADNLRNNSLRLAPVFLRRWLSRCFRSAP